VRATRRPSPRACALRHARAHGAAPSPPASLAAARRTHRRSGLARAGGARTRRSPASAAAHPRVARRAPAGALGSSCPRLTPTARVCVVVRSRQLWRAACAHERALRPKAVRVRPSAGTSRHAPASPTRTTRTAAMRSGCGAMLGGGNRPQARAHSRVRSAHGRGGGGDCMPRRTPPHVVKACTGARVTHCLFTLQVPLYTRAAKRHALAGRGGEGKRAAPHFLEATTRE
jgi:hypothetical protein